MSRYARHNSSEPPRHDWLEGAVRVIDPEKERNMNKPKTNTSVDNLYKSAQAYVEAGGGKLLVIGGVAILEWPQDNKSVFYVVIKCTGKKPIFAVE